MEVVKETVEIIEPEIKTEPKAPSRDELKEKGWSSQELESAEKHGMISKPEEKKEEPKAEVKAEPKAEVKEERRAEERKGTLPEFTFKSPEQEKAFLDAFGAGTEQRAMYFRMKNERTARQRAEQERDVERKRSQDLEARISAMETKKAPAVDENGNEIDPDDKPLTLKQLRELQKSEAEEIEKKNQELNVRASRVTEAQRTQEDYARSIYADFDDTVNKAKEVMQNLETMVPEKWKQAKAIDLIRKLQMAAANADQLDLDDYHAAMIAHEIGQLHPQYGKSAEPDGKTERPEKANGGHTPEQMKRIEANTQRRASSASIPGGGGKRTISVDDIGLKELNAMNYKELKNFRDKHPEKYAGILRG